MGCTNSKGKVSSPHLSEGEAEKYDEYGSESDNQFVKSTNKRLNKVGLGKLGQGRGHDNDSSSSGASNVSDGTREKIMLELEHERQERPKFPYEASGALRPPPDVESIIKQEKVWSDPKFPATAESIFDERITRRLADKTLPRKFEINREKFDRKIDQSTWYRPTEVYQSLYNFYVFKTLTAQDIE